MIKHIVLCILMLSLSACQTTGDIAANYRLSEQVSPGGLPFTHINMPGNPRITIQVAWPSSWAYSANRNPIEPRVGTRLIFAGGATGYPAGETLERINDIGTEGDLWPRADYVFGVLHYSPEHTDETLQIANAHVGNPALDETWFARVRDQYAAQMNETRATPRQQGFQAFGWAALLHTPLRDAVSIPNADVVENVELSEIRQWAKSVFKRNGAIVAVAGDISVADAGYAVDKLFEGLPEGETTPVGSSKANFPLNALCYTRRNPQLAPYRFLASCHRQVRVQLSRMTSSRMGCLVVLIVDCRVLFGLSCAPLILLGQG